MKKNGLENIKKEYLLSQGSLILIKGGDKRNIIDLNTRSNGERGEDPDGDPGIRPFPPE